VAWLPSAGTGQLSGVRFELLERLGQHGKMRTSVVLSTQYEGRPVEEHPADYHRDAVRGLE
jgi:hypothetical protein